MKKEFISVLAIAAMCFICACGRASSAPPPEHEDVSEPIEVINLPVTDEPVDIAESETAPEVIDEPENEGSQDVPEEVPEADDISTNTSRTIVWLGDSLTQGSLGDDNDNLANAPYVKLQSLVPDKVEGYGLYGYNTHDIFWVYRDENHYHQSVDPNKIYIFWVGSNDWCPIDGENTNTAPVIAEIDSFLQSGGVKDYIVMGTTQRWRLGLERAQIINAALASHYGSHYMDVIDIIARNGFSEDNTHLSQASYDAIAEAVYDKLKELGYI